MNLAIADLNHSVEMNREALANVVGALKYLRTVNLGSSSWSTYATRTSSKKKTQGFWPWDRRTVTENYKHYYQKRTQYRRKDYLVSVEY